jgi:hypothetical protein
MPRQSSASRQFAVRSSERLRPPAELTAAEKKIFLVINNPPAHFRPSDLPLLNAYTRAVAMELKFARLIGKDERP